MDIVSSSSSQRYKIGIIDFLTRYNTAKFVENRVKSTLNRVDTKEISAIDPVTYQKRFVQFMKDYL